MKYKNWVIYWLNLYVKPTVKKQTIVRYVQIANNHIIPHLGDYDMEDLEIDIIQNYVASLSNGHKALSANMILAIVGLIKRSLIAAENLGKTKNHYSAKIVYPRARESSVQCFTLAEQKQIERFILNGKTSRWIGVILCLYTGLRIGELLALKWKDVDLVKRTLNVNKSCYYGKDDNNNYCRMEDTPKTKNSTRTIPLNSTLVKLLREVKAESQSQYVVSHNSKPISIRSYQKSFQLLLNRLHVEHKCFHSLRHTFATRALESGMDIKTLAEILGHKNVSLTLNRYAHCLLEHKKTMIDKMGKYCKF